MKNAITAADILNIKAEAQHERRRIHLHSETEVAKMTEDLVDEVIGKLAERAANNERLETFMYFTPIISKTCFVMYANRTWQGGVVQLSVDTRKEINFVDFLNELSKRGFGFCYGPSDYSYDAETTGICKNTVQIYVENVGLRH